MKSASDSEKKTSGQTLKAVVFWIVMLSVFIAELMVQSWSHLQCVQLGYEISRETENHQKLVEIQNRLKIEMARLRSPERISRIARSQLELVTPTSDQKKTLYVYDAD